MIDIEGMGVSPGIASGKVFLYQEVDAASEPERVQSAHHEIKRLKIALNDSIEQLKVLYEDTKKKIGEKDAGIFEAHLLMLEDKDFTERAEKEILNGNKSAEGAVLKARDHFISLFEEMNNDYMKERAADIRDISRRVLNSLSGKKTLGFSQIDGNVIIAANDLTPSDTAQMNASGVLGILTEKGGKTSHTAIIARSLGIPAVVGVQNLMNNLTEGDHVVFDGNDGIVHINPTEDIKQDYANKMNAYEHQKEHWKSLKGTMSTTKDSHYIELAANISSPDDMSAVIENDAEGIGLFRTEFLYMNRSSLPTEQEQYEIYKIIAGRMGNKPVIIRTLDIGGDKAVDYLNIQKEDNAFLGYRAIRLCLDRKDIFKTQLRAILRASAYGNLKIMFPMICTLEELREAKALLSNVKNELKAEKILINEKIETGIMIETPASAVMSDILAKEADFFSIGTNDLIQYTMAADRLNPMVSYLNSFYQPAVIRLIQTVVKNGHKEGICVGICGEAARDPSLVPLWIGMGFNELSMNADSILQVRDIVQKSLYEDSKNIVNRVLEMATESDLLEYIKK